VSSTLAARLRLMVITPDDDATHDQHEATLRAIAPSITALQYRDKGPLEPRARRARAARWRSLSTELGLLFIVNDDPSLAALVDADGVHLGPDDMSPTHARRIVGPDRVIGASAGTPEAALAAIRGGANYLGVGAIFDARASKPNASNARGLDTLRQLRTVLDDNAARNTPIIAIGGIGVGSAVACITHGADGVAVIRAIWNAPRPDEAGRLLRAEVDGNVG